VVNFKIMVLWDVTPHSSVDRYQHFGGIFCPHLQEQLYNITSPMTVTLNSRVNNTQMGVRNMCMTTEA
jgi:hypothetical protein